MPMQSRILISAGSPSSVPQPRITNERHWFVIRAIIPKYWNTSDRVGFLQRYANNWPSKGLVVTQPTTRPSMPISADQRVKALQIYPILPLAVWRKPAPGGCLVRVWPASRHPWVEKSFRVKNFPITTCWTWMLPGGRLPTLRYQRGDCQTPIPVWNCLGLPAGGRIPISPGVRSGICLRRHCSLQRSPGYGNSLEIRKLFVECVICPGFSRPVREILAEKKNCRLLEMPDLEITPTL